MKITYYPAYDITAGSSRLRCYWIQQELLNRGIDARLQSSPFTSDIIVFQKIFTPYCINLAKKAKNRKIKIIFDLDDAFPRSKPMIKLADIVVNASEGLGDYIRKLTNDDTIKTRLIRDPVDYIKQPLPKRKHTKDDNLQIAFYSHPVNLPTISLCKDPIIQLQDEYDLTLVYISGQRRDEFFVGLNYRYEQWDLKTFSKKLRKYDLAVIPQIYPWKTRCKQVQAITHNLPCVCSNTPPFYDLSSNTNTTSYLCKTKDDWFKAIKLLLNPKNRNLFLEKTLDWTWKHHNLKYITDQWIKLFEDLLENNI